MGNNKIVKDLRLLDCKTNDEVYVYKDELFKENFIINKNMIGKIMILNQEIYEDFVGMQSLQYVVVIKLENGKEITIKDINSQPFFRKYEFILLKDLQKMINKINLESQNSLKILKNVTTSQ